ncbi:molybdate ABC transporter substrate-binding protein [Methanobrevibacter filiformis]|uniref:Putative binding protein n=1 Tax=Methanobrevibacter filiformis TaxID=55758 RepID=A0A165Z7A8_9EURY|nr:molybdate ABC transporter substrate-binding protein [Methanobrevibacter filiformis]KZX10341.1 putative binding protein precursor [Methanobrevibacter filiformis]
MANKNIIGIGIIIIIAVAIVGLYASGSLSGGSGEEGTVYLLAGAGFSKVGPELIKEFNKKYPNIKVEVKYAGSGDLFAILETQKKGDVFMPADYKYMEDAINNSYIENNTVTNITKNVPVIIVEKGNPKGIKTLADLSKSGVKVGLGEATGPAIGKTQAKILEKNNLTDNVTKNVVVTSTTVNQLLTYMVTGQLDATIIWEDMTSWKEGDGKIDVVKIPKEQNIISDIPTGVTTFAEDKDAATKLSDFLSSDEGKTIWKKWGFEI